MSDHSPRRLITGMLSSLAILLILGLVWSCCYGSTACVSTRS
jgi:hypothetical protein